MHNNMARLVEATFFLASMLVLASTVTSVAQKQGGEALSFNSVKFVLTT